MSILYEVTELENIKNELKRLRQQTTKLNKQKKVLEQNIQDYLIEQDLPAVKHQNTIIKRELMVRHPRRKKQEKQQDIMDVLHNSGVKNPDIVLENILNAIKGPTIEQEIIKYDQVKKK
jgi:hypothetical protein